MRDRGIHSAASRTGNRRACVLWHSPPRCAGIVKLMASGARPRSSPYRARLSSRSWKAWSFEWNFTIRSNSAAESGAGRGTSVRGGGRNLDPKVRQPRADLLQVPNHHAAIGETSGHAGSVRAPARRHISAACGGRTAHSSTRREVGHDHPPVSRVQGSKPAPVRAACDGANNRQVRYVRRTVPDHPTTFDRSPAPANRRWSPVRVEVRSSEIRQRASGEGGGVAPR